MVETVNSRYIYIYFFSIIALLPISIILGSAISLINVLIISFSFLMLCFFLESYQFLKRKEFLLLIALYFYLIFNSFISLDFYSGFERNFGFLRFILLFLFINYFFFKFEKSDKLFRAWLIIVLFISIDVFIEKFFGRNLAGFGNELYADRIVSFFYDEPVAGSFIYGFSLILIGYLFNKYSGDNKSKATIFLLPLLFLIAVLITGERSNTIKFFIGFVIFFLLPHFFNKKTKIFSVLFFVILILIIFSQSHYLKVRYITQLTNSFTTEQNREEFFKKNIYWSLYKSGINVFKNYPFFGVGNKNYRIETCAAKKDPKTYYLCITHPHQLYIEFLSEHGLFGTIILLSILFFLMFRILGIIIKSKNYIQAGCFLYILTNFIPLLPSGSFFSDFNSTIFWINFSLMYACNKQTNIFYKEDLKLKST